MSDQQPHVTDADILQRLDGELPARRLGWVDAHLAGCGACRTRLARVEAVSLDIARIAPATTGTGHDARVRLARAMQHDAEPWQARSRAGRVLSGVALKRRWPIGAAAALVCAAWLGFSGMQTGRDAAPTPGTHVRPIASVTPGATWEVTRTQVCGTGAPSVTLISEHVRQAVVTAYGMADVPPDEYELDYLITPELGGAPDARNLWPQRYDVPEWNARVKDQLERLLPTLVCEGRVDLTTAQQEIATDWIAAYRKYFRSELPLPPASVDLAEDDGPVFAVLEAPYRLATAPAPKIRVLRTRIDTAKPGRFPLPRI